MPATPRKSTLTDAIARLRAIALSTKEGALVGGEETLIGRMGVSRATVRQAARLLEREGLLRVRRGINGGYFAARPNLHTIEAAVSSYLELVQTGHEDSTIIASILWVEALRRAARTRSAAARALAQEHAARVEALPTDAAFDDVLAVEQEFRTAVFNLITGRYIELIFLINTAFARRHFPHPPSDMNATRAHRDFVRAWKKAKGMEFESIMDGDPDLAIMAARHSRNLWHKRLWSHETP
jgi:DNA-binding GntR family transcriptional regulator